LVCWIVSKIVEWQTVHVTTSLRAFPTIPKAELRVQNVGTELWLDWYAAGSYYVHKSSSSHAQNVTLHHALFLFRQIVAMISCKSAAQLSKNCALVHNLLNFCLIQCFFFGELVGVRDPEPTNTSLIWFNF
jgi:hypothetical protein